MANNFVEVDRASGRQFDCLAAISINPIDLPRNRCELARHRRCVIVVGFRVNAVRWVDSKERESDFRRDVDVLFRLQVVGVRPKNIGPSGFCRSIAGIIHDVARSPIRPGHFTDGLLRIDCSDALTGSLHRFDMARCGVADAVSESETWF